MKIISSLLIALFLLTHGDAHAQVNSNMQTMYMIKDFYTAYASLNFKSADRSKLDSLIDKYFTPEEGKKIKKGYDEGHDIMTNDSGINSKSLETLTIHTLSDQKALNIETGKYEIEKGVKNGYEVDYVVNPRPLVNNSVITEDDIVIDILVVKFNGVVKISYVTNGLTNNLRHNSTHN